MVTYIPYTSFVRLGGNVRTNVEIDDELMRKVLAATGLRTKKAAVDEALRLLLRLREQEKLKDLFGLVPDWDGDLDELRRDRLPDRS